MYLEFYFKIYELDDVKRPANNVIDDDEALDNWLAQTRDENKRDLVEYYRAQESMKQMRGNNRRNYVGPGYGRASKQNG